VASSFRERSRRTGRCPQPPAGAAARRVWLYRALTRQRSDGPKARLKGSDKPGVGRQEPPSFTLGSLDVRRAADQLPADHGPIGLVCRDGLAGALTLAGLSVDGFIVSLGGQSRFGRWLFEDERVSSAAQHHGRGGPSHHSVFRLAPDPDVERLDSDGKCRKNIDEELHSYFNYERDSLSLSGPPFGVHYTASLIRGHHFSCHRNIYTLTQKVSVVS
jgi:hypothetical protein